MGFFFKQKTAYEMRISDWSSDVCSSDLRCLIIVTGRQHTRKWQNGQAEQTVLQQSAPVWIGCHDFFQALPGNGYMRLRAPAARVIGKMRHGEKAPSVVIMTLLNGESGFQPMAGACDRITSGTCLLLVSSVTFR